MAEVNDPGRAKNPIEGNVNGRFAIFHGVFAEVDMGAGVQQHLDLAGLPEAGPAVVAG
jgi:hypothetical protein